MVNFELFICYIKKKKKRFVNTIFRNTSIILYNNNFDKTKDYDELFQKIYKS